MQLAQCHLHIRKVYFTLRAVDVSRFTRNINWKLLYTINNCSLCPVSRWLQIYHSVCTAKGIINRCCVELPYNYKINMGGT